MDRFERNKLLKSIESRLTNDLSCDDFNTAVQELIGILGFSNFHLAPLKPHGGIDFTLSSLPADVAEFYVEFGLHKHDMMIDCMYSNNRPLFQKVVDDYIAAATYKNDYITANVDIKHLLNEFRFYDCFVWPISNDTNRPLNNNAAESCSPWRSKGFFSVYSQGESSELFQKKSRSLSPELRLLATSLYSYSANSFVNLF